MTAEIDPLAHNRVAWDKLVDAQIEWTRPVDSDVIARARQGDWSVVLIGYEPVPRAWFPPTCTASTSSASRRAAASRRRSWRRRARA